MVKISHIRSKKLSQYMISISFCHFFIFLFGMYFLVYILWFFIFGFCLFFYILSKVVISTSSPVWDSRLSETFTRCELMSDTYL